ncbi:MAG: hypothetical protein E7626_03800 [Ruminococcaceae bacterium]|nr:hypothetical protein [Oscillospiraceae bacterium]
MKYEKFGKRSLFTLITCLVLAAVIALNVLVGYLASRNILYLDLTKTSYTDISETSEKYLSELGSEDNNITIYFLAAKDELQNAGFGYSVDYSGDVSDLWGMKHIYELAKVYSEKYDFIKVEHLDIEDDSEILEKYKTSISMTFNKQRIIVDNAVPEKDANGNSVLDKNGEPIIHHNFRISSRDYFYYFDSSSYYAFGFNGELRFTSMLMSVSGEAPVVYFSYGHGENVGDYTVGEDTSVSVEDYGKAQALRDFIHNSGFEVKKIDITSQYEQLLSDKNARALVIFDPKTDFRGADAEVDNDPATVNEISVLRKFLHLENTHLMVFSDNYDGELVNLSEYLYDYWGLKFDRSSVKDSGPSSLSPDGSVFMADYETNKLSPGVSLTAGLTAMDSLPRIYFGNAGTISIDDTFSNEIGFGEGYSVKYSGSIFVTPDSAEVSYADGRVEKGEESTPKSLMAITYEKWYNEGSNEIPTYVLACASTDYVSETAMSSQYGNSDVIGYLLRSLGKDSFGSDIEMKELETEALETPSNVMLTFWKLFIYVIPPIASIVIGTVVFIKRRHA